MTKPPETIIPLSKTKNILLLIGALIFVVIGVFIFLYEGSFFKRTMGIVSILFFGACGIIALKKLFDTQPGLILNQNGITDNTSGFPLGFVPWKEIIGIGEYTAHRQKFIVLILQDPEKYINQGSTVAQKVKRANFNLCGTPFTISANSLQIRYETLFNLLESRITVMS